jgi:ABC-2 type transport system ATP-binding protein
MSMASVKNLTVAFGDFIAVNDLSFSVEAGEIFGLLGANGAGKTTTIRAMLGLLSPKHGTIAIGGFTAEKSDELKALTGYMAQKFILYDDLTVTENLDFVSGLRRIPKMVYQERSRKLLDFIGFSKKNDDLVKRLPSGIRQQVALVAALLHDPKVIFLDEPTSGVTPLMRERFWNLIRSLARENRAILVTTHYMDEASQCDRLALMKDGEMIALDSPKKLKNKVFPSGILELLPKTGVDFSKILAKKYELKPFGGRYHLDPDSRNACGPCLEEMGKTFDIHKVEASLEDVFLKLVDGGT